MILWLLDWACMNEFCILHPETEVRKLCIGIVQNSILVSRDAMCRPEISQPVFILHIPAVIKRLERLRSGDRNTEGIVEVYVTQGNVATLCGILRKVAGAAVDVHDVTIDIEEDVGLRIRIIRVVIESILPIDV